MLHTFFIKCKVDVMYFIFIFILPSVPRFSVKKSVNQIALTFSCIISLFQIYCLIVSMK